MSQYKFVNATSSKPQPLSADSAMRSHAIRTGLQQGSSVLGSQSARQSQEIIKHKVQLTGRFRLLGASSQGLGSAGEKAKKQLHERPSHGLSAVGTM